MIRLFTPFKLMHSHLLLSLALPNEILTFGLQNRLTVADLALKFHKNLRIPKHIKSFCLAISQNNLSIHSSNAYWVTIRDSFDIEIKLPTSTGSLKKQESSRKTSTSALLIMPKPLTVWITINCGKFWKRWEYQITWPASWKICMQVRKQQLELDMEQQTGSK